MPQPVEEVERERRSKDGLACVLENVGEARDELDDVCGREDLRRDEVREGECVQHCSRH